MFEKPEKKFTEGEHPEIPAKKPTPEFVRGGTKLRKLEEALPVHEKKIDPEPGLIKIALKKNWEVKSLPVWKT